MRELLFGAWSHGIAHDNCYGGSHDFRLVLLPDGRGSYCHDGWWIYRYSLFQWELSAEGILTLHAQQYRRYTAMGYDHYGLRVGPTPVRLDFDQAQGRERLTVPLLYQEPTDFYLLTRTNAEDWLRPDFLTSGEFGWLAKASVVERPAGKNQDPFLKPEGSS